MGRIVNVVLLGLMIVAAVATYIMKHQAEQAATLVARLQGKVEKEREAIAELKAEWSLLTQPSRLQMLIARHTEYFRLEPFSASQVAALEELPLKPAPTVDDASGKVAADTVLKGKQ